jgi:hypothetical protein
MMRDARMTTCTASHHRRQQDAPRSRNARKLSTKNVQQLKQGLDKSLAISHAGVEEASAQKATAYDIIQERMSAVPEAQSTTLDACEESARSRSRSRPHTHAFHVASGMPQPREDARQKPLPDPLSTLATTEQGAEPRTGHPSAKPVGNQRSDLGKPDGSEHSPPAAARVKKLNQIETVSPPDDGACERRSRPDSSHADPGQASGKPGEHSGSSSESTQQEARVPDTGVYQDENKGLTEHSSQQAAAHQERRPAMRELFSSLRQQRQQGEEERASHDGDHAMYDSLLEDDINAAEHGYYEYVEAQHYVDGLQYDVLQNSGVSDASHAFSLYGSAQDRRSFEALESVDEGSNEDGSWSSPESPARHIDATDHNRHSKPSHYAHTGLGRTAHVGHHQYTGSSKGWDSHPGAMSRGTEGAGVGHHAGGGLPSDGEAVMDASDFDHDDADEEDVSLRMDDDEDQRTMSSGEAASFLCLRVSVSYIRDVTECKAKTLNPDTCMYARFSKKSPAFGTLFKHTAKAI